MRRLLVLLVALVPTLVVAQVTWNKEMPPSHEPIPAPKAFTWDLDGHHIVEFTWELGPEEPMEGYYPDTCNNECRGKKHFLHEQCDTSCDRTCSELHRATIKPYLYLDHSEFLDQPDRFDKVFGRELSKVGVGKKYPWDQVAWGMIEQIRKPVENDPKLAVDVKWNHWVKGPCEHALRCHVAYSTKVTLIWEVFRYDTAPDGRQVKVSGGKHRTPLGSFSIPQDGVAEEYHTIYCQCSIVNEDTTHTQEPPEEKAVPPAPQTPGEEKRTGAVIQENSSGTAVCDSQTLEKFKFNVVCQDMNECTVSCTNPTTEQQTFIVCPGTFFLSSDPAYQNMVCTSAIRLVVPPGMSVCQPVEFRRAGPFALDELPEVSGKGRLLCMNVELREPRPEVAYRIAGSAGRSICALAKYTYGSSIKGTQDQVRMWIATDGATFDKCISVLFPKPREGLYADCLYQAHHIARLNSQDPKFANCFDPKLVVGAAKPQTTAWLVPELVRRSPDKLAAWVTSNSAAFAPLFSEANTRLGIPHAGRLAAELCRSVDPRVRKAGIDFLLKAVPEASRAAVADAGGLNGAGQLLLTGSAEEAKLALDVFEAYRQPASAFYLRNLNAGLPEDVKARAATLVKAFPPR
jgi:hypothetical protein